MTRSESQASTSVIRSATKAQMRAARHDVSAWVSANAGAGKTRVLVDRVVRLLLAGTPPGAVLCLTYTNAAAAEMSNRLFGRLAEWAVMPDRELTEQIKKLPGLEAAINSKLLLNARNLFAQALETPGGLKIQTIHAFCERILQRFPLEANVPAGFSVLDERQTTELLSQAIRRALSSAGRVDDVLHDDFCHISSLLDEGSLGELISDLAADRAVRIYLGNEDEIDSHLNALIAAWNIPPDLDEAALLDGVTGGRAFPAERYQVAATVLSGGSSTDQKHAKLIRALLGPEATPSARFDILAGYYLTQKGTARSSLITAKTAKTHPQVKIFLEDQQHLYLEAVPLRRSLQLLAANRSLLRLGGKVIQHFELAKRMRALLDYDDLIMRTHALLSRSHDAEWVLYKLDGGIDHVLIDEAQDTSPDQWNIVRSLTQEFFSGAGSREETRTIFAVGDEKQSIYSFQGAEPRRFGEMQDWFAEKAAGHWLNVPLEVSFRSAGAILSAVDQVFGSEPARQGLGWREEGIRHIPSREAAGMVEIWPAELPEPGNDEKPFPAPVDEVPQSSPEIRLADRISARIEQWLRDGAILKSQNRPVRAGDILILVRRRGIFADAMVRALKRRNLPVAGADRMALGEQLAIQDLMALGDFILQPDDDLSLACVLKSPLIGMQEDELLELAAERPASLWLALCNAAGHEDASGAAIRAHKRIRRWKTRGMLERPFDFFAGLLDGEGLRRDMIKRLGTEADDPISEFLGQAIHFEQNHTATLQGFLAWMRSGDTQIKRDMEHGKDEVRVMTVHGAKGLEAGIVFLPDTCTTPVTGRDTRLLSLPELESGLPVWTVSKSVSGEILAEAYETAATSRREEYHRLLYVAMTRAKDELYICGFENKRGRAEGCWYDLIHQALAPFCDTVPGPAEDAPMLRYRYQNQTRSSDVSISESPSENPLIEPIPQWALQKPSHESIPGGSLSPSRPAGLPGLPPFTPAGSNRFRRGNLVHRLLELLPAIASDERRERARLFLLRPDNRLDETAAEELIDEVLSVLENPVYAPWFGPDSRAEVPFAAHVPDENTGTGGQRPVYGQIDRITFADQEVRILDYKTSRPVPACLEDIPEIYLRQMAAYRRGIQRIFPDKPVMCALLWTDGPLLTELPDTLLDSFK